jgi:hypothetical protein
MLTYIKDLARLLRRIAVTVVGTVILAVGVVLLVAPGPGLVMIVIALAVFAIEYEWARRHLAAAACAHSAAHQAAASCVATASAVLFGLGAIGLGAVLIFTDVLPLSGAGSGAGVAAAGVTVLTTLAYAVWELRRALKAHEDNSGGQAGAATGRGSGVAAYEVAGAGADHNSLTSGASFGNEDSGLARSAGVRAARLRQLVAGALGERRRPVFSPRRPRSRRRWWWRPPRR